VLYEVRSMSVRVGCERLCASRGRCLFFFPLVCLTVLSLWFSFYFSLATDNVFAKQFKKKKKKKNAGREESGKGACAAGIEI
jgi:hypothetical protein